MRQLIITILLATGITASFAQTNSETATKDSVVLNQKFYFPPVLFKDSVAFNKAIPKLAEQLLGVYTEPDKRSYYESTAYYYLLAGNNKKAIDLLDSVQAIDMDKSYAIEIKSYAIAKSKETSGASSFDNIFKKEFAAAFNALSFRKKVSLALFDSTTVNWFHTSYTEFSEKMRKNTGDSLSLEDAQSLCDKFSMYVIYDKIFPLMLSVTNQPQYMQSFPAINGGKWSGVLPVQGIDEMPDPNMKYKLLMELTAFAPKGQESTAKKEINGGLGEVARKLNLHVANGIPKKNIDLVIVVHAAALYAFMSNEKYKRKYKIDNPNLALIKELQDFGAKIIVCGQAMTFFNLEREDMAPGIKQALTAQTVLSSYQLKGYVFYNVKLEQ